MLSPKARAFSVDHLLAKSDHENVKTFTQNENHWLQAQDVPTYDPYFKTVYDDSGTRTMGIELGHSDLWEAFHRFGTEMIITRSGRRMFPALRVRLTELQDDRDYRVYLDFMPLDQYKYRYVYHSSQWMVSGTGECAASGQKYVHSDTPRNGRYLMSRVISFEKLKLTNHDKPKQGQMSLGSMQKYIPRLHLELLNSDLEVEAHWVTTFDLTSFMAVTAYQNQEITRLKIARNPFAKGFRESIRNRSHLEAMMSSGCYMRQRHKTDEDHWPGKIYKPFRIRMHDVSGCPFVYQTNTTAPYNCNTSCGMQRSTCASPYCLNFRQRVPNCQIDTVRCPFLCNYAPLLIPENMPGIFASAPNQLDITTATDNIESSKSQAYIHKKPTQSDIHPNQIHMKDNEAVPTSPEVEPIQLNGKPIDTNVKHFKDCVETQTTVDIDKKPRNSDLNFHNDCMVDVSDMKSEMLTYVKQESKCC